MGGLNRLAPALFLISLWVLPARAQSETAPSHRATVLLLDTSGSLRRTDPSDLRSEAARLFLDSLPLGDKVRVYSFAGSAEPLDDGWLEAGAPGRSATERALARAGRAGRYTDHVAALEAAASLFEAQPPAFRAQYKPTIVLFTDGILDPDPSFATATERRTQVEGVVGRLRRLGAEVHAISLGGGELQLLRSATEATGGATLEAARPHELLRAFWHLRERVSNAYTVVDRRRIEGPQRFDVGDWVDGLTLAVFCSNGQPCEAELAGPRPTQCESASGRSHLIFTCPKPPSGEWVLRAWGKVDVAAAATGDVHLTLEMDPAVPVVGEAVRVSIAPRAGATLLAGLPFLADAVAEVRVADQTVALFDDGAQGDEKAGDGIFSRAWRPTAAGVLPTTARLEGSTFRLATPTREIEVLPAPVVAALATIEIGCFTESGCGEKLNIRNLLADQALRLRSTGDFYFDEILLPPASEKVIPVTYRAPAAGTAQQATGIIEIEGFLAPVRVVATVRRLTLPEFLTSYWYFFGPGGLTLIAGIALAARRPTLRGQLRIEATPDGGTTAMTPVDLDGRHLRRIGPGQFSIPDGSFALECRKKGPIGSKVMLQPIAADLLLIRRGKERGYRITAPHEVESGDRWTFRSGDTEYAVRFNRRGARA